MKHSIPTLALSLLIFFGCKNSIFKDCCQNGFENTAAFTLYQPSGYTPDGDGLNELFKIFPKAPGSNVQFVTNLSATNTNGDVVFTKDTMWNVSDTLPDGNRLTSPSWDFKNNQGDVVFGKIEIRFTVVDVNNQSHSVSYQICSHSCPSLDDDGGTMDFSKCRYEDQIDLERGFVLPTSEPGC